MQIINMVILFIAGISFGSFLNVVADRLQNSMSLLFPPSHCFNCQHKLEYRDLIPVFSYLVLRGRCRYCRIAISPRTFFVELMTGIIFTLAWLKFGYSPYLAVALFSICIFILLGIIDINKAGVASVTIFSAILITLLLSLLSQFIDSMPEFFQTIAGFFAGCVPVALIWLILKVKGRTFSMNYMGLVGLAGAILGIPMILLAVCIYLLFSVFLKICVLLWNKTTVNIFDKSGMIFSSSVILTMIAGDDISRIILRCCNYTS